MDELLWIAGFLEGEGSFGYYPQSRSLIACASQVNPEPLHRLRRAVGGTVRHDRRGWWVWSVYGDVAYQVMAYIYWHMSRRRQRQIRSVLHTFNHRTVQFKRKPHALRIPLRANRR